MDISDNSHVTSIQQTRNLLRIAIYNISYIRGLFHEKYFSDKSVPALGRNWAITSNQFLYPKSTADLNVPPLKPPFIAAEMKIKKLMPMDAESRRLIDWMEKGETCPDLI
jgi:hypothetical protein